MQNSRLALVGLLALLMITFIAGFYWLFVAVNRETCQSIHRETGAVTKFDNFGGCFVNRGGEWIPLSAWRVDR